MLLSEQASVLIALEPHLAFDLETDSNSCGLCSRYHQHTGVALVFDVALFLSFERDSLRRRAQASRVASIVPRLPPGSTFAERFRILAYLGQGRRGSVYRAEPLAGGEQVALEVASLGTSPDPQVLDDMEGEVESGMRGESPHVGRQLDSGSLPDAGLAWVTMALSDGETAAAGAATRPSVVVPGAFVTLVILSVVFAGFAIYWLLRSMRI